ncbi:MAG: zinc-ribbon domain-containing protein, partial [Deltaproteobacteria bacterium]|nr:zinc-ribbon domain-containing protein [Deltaproteobacteria bacterium]
MIIQCDKCSTKFRLDDSRVSGNGVRVRCTKCQNVFIVAPPPPVEEVGVEEVLGNDRVSSGAFETASKRPATPARRPLDDYNLKFDFARPSGKDAGEQEPSGEPPAVHSDAPAEKKPVSFDEIDFSFSTDRPAGKP